MFKGRIYYQHGGYMSNAIRFLADGADDGGVATTTYSYSMTQEERHEMARRITAALNLTRDMETEEIERRAGMTSNVQSDRRCAASSRSVQRAKRTGSTVGLCLMGERRANMNEDEALIQVGPYTCSDHECGECMQKVGVGETAPECTTCSGTGTIDERLGGEWNSNPKAECPDCDGTGELRHNV